MDEPIETNDIEMDAQVAVETSPRLTINITVQLSEEQMKTFLGAIEAATATPSVDDVDGAIDTIRRYVDGTEEDDEAPPVFGPDDPYDPEDDEDPDDQDDDDYQPIRAYRPDHVYDVECPNCNSSGADGRDINDRFLQCRSCGHVFDR